jgi:hypothetical protein
MYVARYYGNINPQNTLQYITAQFQTGDMHIAIYDFENSMMYVGRLRVFPPHAIPSFPSGSW